MRIYQEMVEDLQSFTPDLSDYQNTAIFVPSTFKGCTHSDHAKKLLSEKSKKQWMDGKKSFSQEKMIEGNLRKYGVENYRHIKGECPHCKKQGQLVALKRWHFDNCKNITSF